MHSKHDKFYAININNCLPSIRFKYNLVELDRSICIPRWSMLRLLQAVVYSLIWRNKRQWIAVHMQILITRVDDFYVRLKIRCQIDKGDYSNIAILVYLSWKYTMKVTDILLFAFRHYMCVLRRCDLWILILESRKDSRKIRWYWFLKIPHWVWFSKTSFT